MKILIADDEDIFRKIIVDFLKKDGYQVIEATNGKEALTSFMNENVDLVILDVMMPELDGISTCKRIKSSPKKDIPVLILTAKDTDDDQIEALEAGADDYISKPFSFPILLLRVKSLLKRVLSNEETLKVNDVEVDVQKHTVKSKDELVELTPKEFELLVLLMRNKNNVITRESILEQIWGYDYFGDNRTVDTHIKNLRIKIKDENLIKTVRGYGYVINE